LIDNGADVKQIGVSLGNIVVNPYCEELAQIFKGADFNYLEDGNRVPLCQAIGMLTVPQHAEFIGNLNYLIDCGADINFVNPQG
jgi:hypothetical protein